MIGINLFTPFLVRGGGREARATITDVVMHIDHINTVIPPDYLATVVLRNVSGPHHVIYGNDDLGKVCEVLNGAATLERTAPMTAQ